MNRFLNFSQEFPWPYQAGSSLIFGFGIGGVMVPSLTFTMDSYPEVSPVLEKSSFVKPADSKRSLLARHLWVLPSSVIS